MSCEHNDLIVIQLNSSTFLQELVYIEDSDRGNRQHSTDNTRKNFNRNLNPNLAASCLPVPESPSCEPEQRPPRPLLLLCDMLSLSE